MSAPITKPERVAQRARERVNHAVKTGKLLRPSHCDECGRAERIEAHHHRGYEPAHALDVVWLCRRCHHTADADAHERGRRARIGVLHSPERRAAISAATKGRVISPAQRASISASLKGRYFSPEHRAKISAGLQGRQKGAEHRAKLSMARKGKTLALEHRAKLIGKAAGEKNPRAKLCEEDVRAIRSLAAKGICNAALASMYDVSENAIWKLITGRTWRHLG